MKRQVGGVGRPLVAVVFSLVVSVVVLPGTNWTAPADPNLVEGDYALVAVKGSAAGVAARAMEHGATDVAALDAVGVVTGRMTNSALRALRSDPRVAYIATDAVVTMAGKKPEYDEAEDTPASPWAEVIAADKAWASATGRGVTVALMDTAVADHPDLGRNVAARVDFVRDGDRSPDSMRHGTFVAGLIAGNGASFRGAAPDAKIVSLRVLDRRGNGTMHSVLAAFDWLLKNRLTYRIRVLNLSFGAPQTTTYHRELLSGVVESAWFAGIAVVAAAGNDGPGARSVANPGADPFVITVGSLNDEGTAGRNDDRESQFSARGPTRDGFVKPDVLAPGEHVASLQVGDNKDRAYSGGERGRGGDDNDDDYGYAARDGKQAKATKYAGYGRLSGTSAASALVTGVAALVLQAKTSYTPTQVKGALVAGGWSVRGSRTPAVDARNSLSVRPAKVNAGIAPSMVLVKALEYSGQLAADVEWGSISWEGVSWESVAWEGVSWETISWESVTWESVTWESVTYYQVTRSVR